MVSTLRSDLLRQKRPLPQNKFSFIFEMLTFISLTIIQKLWAWPAWMPKFKILEKKEKNLKLVNPGLAQYACELGKLDCKHHNKKDCGLDIQAKKLYIQLGSVYMDFWYRAYWHSVWYKIWKSHITYSPVVWCSSIPLRCQNYQKFSTVQKSM